MGGHATHDEREARATFDKALFEYWGKRDPVGLFETYLVEGTLDLESGQHLRDSAGLRDRNTEVLKRVEQRVTDEVERAAEDALGSRAHPPQPESAAEGVYANTATPFAVQAAAGIDRP
jgi:TPP-dependent pyruvate/acetoin dehydrogenase alpha subunit